MRRRVFFGASPLAAGVAALLAAPLPAQEPVGAVDVRVTVDPSGTAHVEEAYRIAPAPPTFELRALLRPCADIRDVRVRRGGVERALVAERDGPWVLHRDTTAGRADTLLATVAYDVATSAAEAQVPLLHPTTPIPQRDGERVGTVHVRVRFTDAGGAVRFPHMTSVGEGAWDARYVAIPSFVEIARAAPAGEAACSEAGGPSGDDGGLTWRFLLLVGIMAAWVPTYLAWARRSTEDGP